MGKSSSFPHCKGVEGLPDPPLDVEVVQGYSNSLDVNWIPVTITEKGTSNGARVTGYKVYINDFPCTEVTSPTADCVTAMSWMVERAAKRSHSEVLRVVVRTQSCEGESADSNEVVLPIDKFNFKFNQLIKPKGSEAFAQRTDLSPEGSIEDHDDQEDSTHVANGVSASDEPRERSDSVRRFSRDENGQPLLIVLEETPKQANVAMDYLGPLAQPRTKEEPVVWKSEAGDESETNESVTKSDGRGSEDEDDEEVEICIPDVSEDQAPSAENEAEVNGEEQGNQHREEEDEEEEKAEIPENEQNFDEEDVFADEETSEIQEEELQRSTKESDLSAASDIDMDDDFMDLLEEDEPTGQGMDFGSVRKISQTERASTLNSQPVGETSDGMGFGKYLAQSSKQSKADASLDSIRLEEDQIELGENDGLEHSYSDTEADYGGVERSSTPLDDERGMEQQEEALQRPVYDEAASATEGQAPSDEGYVGEMAPEERVRVFLALYDYDPSTMSPNPDAEEEELAFNEGDLIRVYGDKDEDGFFWGDLNGQAGYIPSNMVSEVDLEYDESDSNVTTPSVNVTQESAQAPEESPSQELQVIPRPCENLYEEVILEEGEFDDPRESDNYQLPYRRMVALFDYDPQTLSPNPDSEMELKFRVGDVICVYGDMDEDGFFTGELRGVRGLVPSNFLEDLSNPDDATQHDNSNDSDVTESSMGWSDKYSSINGTPHVTEDTPKKKKGIFSKGKQMFKKIAKGHNSPRGNSSKR